MGTVSHFINCPNCNSKNCEKSFDCKTKEELIFCPNCGYVYNFQWKRDNEGKFILKNKSKGISLDNLFPEITEVENPFCAYCIKDTEGYGREGTIKDSAEYSAFINYYEKLKKKGNIKLILIRRFLNGEFIEEEL